MKTFETPDTFVSLTASSFASGSGGNGSRDDVPSLLLGQLEQIFVTDAAGMLRFPRYPAHVRLVPRRKAKSSANNGFSGQTLVFLFVCQRLFGFFFKLQIRRAVLVRAPPATASSKTLDNSLAIGRLIFLALFCRRRLLRCLLVAHEENKTRYPLLDPRDQSAHSFAV